jgi:hypothetical protein
MYRGGPACGGWVRPAACVPSLHGAVTLQMAPCGAPAWLGCRPSPRPLLHRPRSCRSKRGAPPRPPWRAPAGHLEQVAGHVCLGEGQGAAAGADLDRLGGRRGLANHAGAATHDCDGPPGGPSGGGRQWRCGAVFRSDIRRILALAPSKHYTLT